MCGIVCYKGKSKKLENLQNSIDRIGYRGPDNTKYEQVSDDIIFGFHRLAIMGLTESGDQPMKHPKDDTLSLICNGEIYNYKILGEKYNFELVTGSDCEIILLLYKKIGLEKTVKELDGVFMFVLYDSTKNRIYAARDPYGVRPGFIAHDEYKNEFMIASEAKPLVGNMKNIKPFHPGSWWSSEKVGIFNKYHFTENNIDMASNEIDICHNINTLLTEAVKKRLMSNREIGCLLSGGLDSSLICAIVAKHYSGPKLNTFSIGMPGSIDLEYAGKVAEYLGTKHHQIEISKEEFLNAIEIVIYNIESYDTTTVRASVGNFLLGKYITNNTDCKVIFNGDGSDEVSCGYVYLKNAPDPLSLHQENERLLEEIHYFDVLRSDRSMSCNGLEARTPFLDKAFVDYYLSIPAKLKMFDGANRLEKHLLRKAFEDDQILPEEVLWRRKCAFSDGVSSQKKSWHKIIQSFVDEIVTDKEFNENKDNYIHCRPQLKESYFYRKIFEKYFEGNENLIPHFWLPRWTEVIDPSARELVDYHE